MTPSRLQHLNAYVQQLAGETISNATVGRNDGDPSYDTLVISTESGLTLVLTTQDTEGYNSWLQEGD